MYLKLNKKYFKCYPMCRLALGLSRNLQNELEKVGVYLSFLLLTMMFAIAGGNLPVLRSAIGGFRRLQKSSRLSPGRGRHSFPSVVPRSDGNRYFVRFIFLCWKLFIPHPSAL